MPDLDSRSALPVVLDSSAVQVPLMPAETIRLRPLTPRELYLHRERDQRAAVELVARWIGASPTASRSPARGGVSVGLPVVARNTKPSALG